jgi:hypothetical protein
MAHRALQLLANGPTGLVNETCWSGVAGEEGRNEGSRYSPHAPSACTKTHYAELLEPPLRDMVSYLYFSRGVPTANGF